MARSLNGSNQYLSGSSALTTTNSYSVSAWLRLTGAGNYLTAVTQIGTHWSSFFFGINSSGDGVKRWAFVSRSADTESGSSEISSKSSSEASSNVWTHLVGVYDSVGQTIQLYVDGSAQTAASHTGMYASPNGMMVGAAWIPASLNPAQRVDYWPGDVAEVGLYAAALNSSQISSLAAGCSPASVRPDVLRWYGRLINGDGDADYWGQNNLTANNSPTYATHPPIIYRSRPRVVLAPRTYYAGGSPAIGGAAIGANPIGGSSQVGTAAAPPSTYANYYLHTNNTFGAFGLGHTTGLIAS